MFIFPGAPNSKEAQKPRKLEQNRPPPKGKKNALRYTFQHWKFLPHKTHKYISKGLTLQNTGSEAPEQVPSLDLSQGVDADQL